MTVDAVWTELTADVPAGSQAQFRIQASDGDATGDLVEAGLDDISICPAGDPGNQNPTASFTADPTSGEAPLEVSFDASASSDPEDGTVSSYAWDFGDGSPAGSGATPSHTYTAPGNYTGYFN